MNPQALQYLPFVLTPIATLIVVVVGVLFSNHHVDTRLSDTNSRFNDTNNRFNDTNRRIDDLRAYFDVRLSSFESQMNTHFNASDALFQERMRRMEEVMDARLRRIEDLLNIR